MKQCLCRVEKLCFPKQRRSPGSPHAPGTIQEMVEMNSIPFESVSCSSHELCRNFHCQTCGQLILVELNRNKYEFRRCITEIYNEDESNCMAVSIKHVSPYGAESDIWCRVLCRFYQLMGLSGLCPICSRFFLLGEVKC